MSNHTVIGMCVKRIMADIDINLLERAFRPKTEWHQYDTFNLEHYIENIVVRDYVMTDLNLISGQTERILLNNIPYEQINDAHVYRIPMNKTHGRRITAVHGVEYGHADTGLGHHTVMQVLADATMGPKSTGHANVELVGPNTVAVFQDSSGWNTFIRVQLEHDENLANFNPRYQRSIAQLCVHAAKHLIHVRVSDYIGDGDALGGAPSNYLRQRIDEYRDAKDIYEEELAKIPKKSLMNDKRNHRRIIKLGISR